MHLKNTVLESLSPSAQSNIRALMVTIALSVSSCIGHQPASSNTYPFDTYTTEEGDIDNPVFITLVGVGAELQASINTDEENGYTLEYVWQTLKSELEKRTEFRDVSVSVVSPKKTERGYIYMNLEVTDKNGKVWQNGLYARDKEAAEEKIQCLRDNFMLYIKEKMAFMSPTGVALAKDAIIQILQIEKEAFQKHQMTYEVQPDGENWIIVFHYTGEEKFGLICLGDEVE